MAQIMVDTETESIAGLMTICRMLTDFAAIKAAEQQAQEKERPSLEDHIHPNPVLTVSGTTSGIIEPGATIVDGATGKTLGTVVGAKPEEPDPTKLFGKFPVPTGATNAPTNVVPLFSQPVLNLPGATGPAVLGVPAVTNMAPAQTTLPAGIAAPVLGVTNAAPSSSIPAQNAVGANTVVSAVVDSQGLPWDARIHSSSKKTKGDGTWKLARGLPEGLAQQVTAELLAAKLTNHVTATGAPVPQGSMTIPTNALPVFNSSVPPVAGIVPPGAGDAVNAPQVPATGVVGIASNPTVPLPPASRVPVYPGVSVLPATTAMPGNLPNTGGVPVAPESPVKRFGVMMSKISAALGERRITQQQVLDAHRAPGIQLDQLQQAVLHPDKIPLIEAALGLA
jgi:hypothetical protein